MTGENPPLRKERRSFFHRRRLFLSLSLVNSIPRGREGGTPRCAQDSTLFPLLRFSLSASDQIYGTRTAIFAPATPVGGEGGIQSRFSPRRRRPFHRAAATDREEEKILNCTPVADFSGSLGLSREKKKLRRQKKKRIAKESTQGGGRGL